MSNQSYGMNSQAYDQNRPGMPIHEYLNRAVKPEHKPKVLPPLPAKGAIGVQVGIGEWKGGGAAAGGGGIASPLTEADASTREYWPDGLRSSDGLFVLPAIKTLNMTDASGAEVVIQLANPDTPA